MANGKKKYGLFRYGKVYASDANSPDGRGRYLGQLIIDQDKQAFYIRPENKPAHQIPNERVNWFLSNDLIEFDHEYSKQYLVSYMMKLESGQEANRSRRLEEYNQGQRIEEMKVNTKLNRTTRRRAFEARLLWVVGCLAIVALGYVASLPEAVAPPAEASIAGVGEDYGVESEVLQKATYLKALGNGPKLYGLLFNDDIVENGQRSSGENVRQENVLINAEVSTKYPIHLRPLYYDKIRYYQTIPQINDATQGSSAVCLQNPNGYSLGVAANDLVYIGGQGMATITLSSPGQFQPITAQEAQATIEARQSELLNSEREGKPVRENLGDRPTYEDATVMPESWNGYDSCDIDQDIVVASYWYTKNNSKQQADLMRRVAVWNIAPVLTNGSAGVNSMELIQLNYQDKDSSYYEPVVSYSPSSHDVAYWIGYTKETASGDKGFFIRHYTQASDILEETYENTFSAEDLTNNPYPITNYKLHGDYLFFEQQGYIWVMNLSKLKVAVSGEQRTIEKENPTRICRITEVQATVDRDDAFAAQLANTTADQTSQYQIIAITTSAGVEYGIAFIEADTGNLVFQPCRNPASSATYVGEGGGGNANQATSVTNTDQAYLNEAARMKAEQEKQQNAFATNDFSNMNSTAPPEYQNLGTRNLFTENQTVNGMQTASGNDDTLFGNISLNDRVNGSTPAPSLGDEENNGRILIKASSDAFRIVCFTVRGEQFYWIEENTKTAERKLMRSPVYYKNDALQILSDELTADDPAFTNVASSSTTINGTKEDGDTQVTQRTIRDGVLTNASNLASVNATNAAPSNQGNSNSTANTTSNDGAVTTQTTNSGNMNTSGQNAGAAPPGNENEQAQNQQADNQQQGVVQQQGQQTG